jgi:hypothetical protein
MKYTIILKFKNKIGEETYKKLDNFDSRETAEHEVVWILQHELQSDEFNSLVAVRVVEWD